MSSSPFRRDLLAFALVAVLSPGVASGQPAEQEPSQLPSPSTTVPSQADDPQARRRFFDVVTVSATLNEREIRETPGTVSVIDAATIDREMVENIADLVRFEPGVYVETVPGGVGLNGFNIRGMGGNRVKTQIDGVDTAEQFDFGPFNMHQQAIDTDTLKSAEIVRSAGSSLYGSDALGGVVSFFTKDPADYLRGRRFSAAGRTSFDGRTGEATGNIAIAAGGPRVEASLFVSYGSGHELRNQGTVFTEDGSRTAPNDQDRSRTQTLGKVVVKLAPGNVLRGAIETSDQRVDTDVFSSYGNVVIGPITTRVSGVVAEDTLARRRFSLDHRLDNRFGLNALSWQAYYQRSDVEQVIDEVRETFGQVVNRTGTMEQEQRGYGLSVQARKVYAPAGNPILFTAGASFGQDHFDGLRDRHDIDAATGTEIPPSVIVPTKYFPATDVRETGAYLQAEMRLGRTLIVPALRYDSFTIDADQNDRIYLDSMNAMPVDLTADRVTARLGASFDVTEAVVLHGQYAGGFRAPPYSDINNGFTNVQAGYISLANPDLRPESSNNFDFGVRAGGSRVSVGVTGFANFYDDFIETATVGFNPATGLQEFQNQNIATVTIRGVEFVGDAQLTPELRLRAGYAVIRGHDVTGDEDMPLNSIAPDQGVVGLDYTRGSNRWGASGLVRFSTAQAAERAGEGMFTPDGYAVIDLFAWISLGSDVTLRAGLLNVADTTYYEWANIRGRAADSPVITRYTSPGRSGIVSLAYGW
jgi:hemoglobin/transferrin/lactoferrin receptor protein